VSGFRVGYAVVPAFYAAVERLDDPALRARPIVVGGDPRKRGKVQSASREALAASVVVGMAMNEVAARCPDVVFLRTNMKRYREVSSVLQGAMREVSRGLETDGLAAGFFELESELHADREAVDRLSKTLVEHVRDDVGLPVQLGIAPVKFLARLAADAGEDEGRAVTCVSQRDVDGFLAPIAVERLPGVGAKTLAVLQEMKIECVRELRACDPRMVERALGRQAGRILAYARGEDPAPVRVAPHPKSVSLHVTFDAPVTERESVEKKLAVLCQDAEVRLRQQQLETSRMTLKLRYDDADKPRTWTRKLVRPVARAEALYAAGIHLLDRSEVGLRAVRLLGLTLAGLSPHVEDDRQLDLFDA
jgi:DNA polymerase-4